MFFETNHYCGSILCLDQPSTRDGENWQKIIIIPPIPYTTHLTLSDGLGEVPQVSVRPRTRSQNSISIAFVFDSFWGPEARPSKDSKRRRATLIGIFLNWIIQNPSQSSHATAWIGGFFRPPCQMQPWRFTRLQNADAQRAGVEGQGSTEPEIPRGPDWEVSNEIRNLDSRCRLGPLKNSRPALLRDGARHTTPLRVREDEEDQFYLTLSKSTFLQLTFH